MKSKKSTSATKPPKAKKTRTTVVIDADKEVKAIARERVGPVKASRVIVPKDQRSKEKHKKPYTGED
jgi:hypothetical protein